MKLSVEELKELYSWIKKAEYGVKIDSYLNKKNSLTNEDVKRIKNELEQFEYGYPKEFANNDPVVLAATFENGLKEAINKFDSWMIICEHMLATIRTFKNSSEELAECDGELATLVTAIKPSSPLYEDKIPYDIKILIREAYGDEFDQQFEHIYNEWIRLGYKPEDAVALTWQSFLCSCVAEKEECDSAENEWKVSMSVKIIGSEFAKKLCEANQNFADWMKASMNAMEFVKAYRAGINNSLIELDNVFTGLSKQ